MQTDNTNHTIACDLQYVNAGTTWDFISDPPAVEFQLPVLIYYNID